MSVDEPPAGDAEAEIAPPAFMSALVTEHFVLQSTAAATIGEAGTRSSLYLLSLSTSLVALGFSVGDDGAFGAMAATVIPTLLLLGGFTVVRLVDLSVENVAMLRRIARIRRFYAELTPNAAEFFPTRGSDALDAQDMLGIRYTRSSLLFTLASTVGTINAVLAAAGVTLLLRRGLDSPLPVAVGLGAVVGVLITAATLRYQARRFAAAFPQPTAEPTERTGPTRSTSDEHAGLRNSDRRGDAG